MTEPRTKVGKALLTKLGTINASRYATVSFPFADEDIAAIEAEARTALLAELRSEVERLPKLRLTAHGEPTDTYAINPASVLAILDAKAERS